MGRMLVRALATAGDLGLGAATERAGHAALGQDAGELAGAGRLGVGISADLPAALAACDLAIDFTAPSATLALVELAVAHHKPVVVGTTGLSDGERAALAQAAERIPLVVSANMSLGVNLLAELCEKAARALGPSYDAEIVELHHRLKKDSPSGTALLLGQAVAAGKQLSLAEHAVHGRDGLVGERPRDEIGFHAVRGGDVVGEHTVYFLGPGERIALTHLASSRETFAAGALVAARWLVAKPPGLYTMKHVLGL